MTSRLTTPTQTVQKLQISLQAKAKAEPAFRFHALWDKVCRADVIAEAYGRCRANDGAPGVDGITFDRIEADGLDRWLEMLGQELKGGLYRPQPLRRVWIPKSNGTRRPLGIPTIRDRTVMMAVALVVGPIFEADLLDNQYGFRPGLDAKMAVRRMFWHVRDRGRREVVDADLRDYFTSIPHGSLMRCLTRRIADGRLLRLIKSWLTVTVVERVDRRMIRSAEARRTKKGTPQGSPLSPMLANLYFRRFALAWRDHGREAIEQIAWARRRGLTVHAETCPQYLVLTAADLDRPGMEGAKFICSPPPRDADSQAAVWRALAEGTFQTFSSDHCPFRYDDEAGKTGERARASFRAVPNGIPGVAARLPILFSEGVVRGRITSQDFVALTSTNHARLYGLYPRKGSIAIGADADIALWDPTRRVTLTQDLMHHGSDYTPYEGLEVTGWPVTTLVRGRVVFDDGWVVAEAGHGAFLPRGALGRHALPEAR